MSQVLLLPHDLQPNRAALPHAGGYTAPAASPTPPSTRLAAVLMAVPMAIATLAGVVMAVAPLA